MKSKNSDPNSITKRMQHFDEISATVRKTQSFFSIQRVTGSLTLSIPIEKLVLKTVIKKELKYIMV